MNIGYVIKFQKASGLRIIYYKQPPFSDSGLTLANVA